MQVVGTKRVNYQKDGKDISGTTLYVEYSDERVEGVCAENLWISARSDVSIKDICIGDLIDVGYNKYGRVDSVRKVD